MVRKTTIVLTSLAFIVAAGIAQGQLVKKLIEDIINGVSSVNNVAKLLLGVLAFFSDGLEYYATEIPDMTPKSNAVYDFIVVGAGSASAAIASRLSEIPEVTLLLIEAGSNENILMDIPLIALYLQFPDDINWKYQTEPSDKYCLGLEGKRCNWPRGRVLGGTSALNYMIATRGNRRDYDHWAELGNTGWSYEEVLPYFKKLENMDIPELKDDVELHNTNGPMNISYPPYHGQMAEGFLGAARELGFDIIDYNGRTQAGFSYIQANVINGSRVSTNRAYLTPAKDRKNLFVTQNSLVSKVLINPDTRRAEGVEFTKGMKNYTVRAGKEVILCAGAIGSPQLLMLSGIGPAEHLSEMGIPLIKDAQVGENLMDHIHYGGMIFLVNQSLSTITSRVLNPLNPDIQEYLTERSGPLTAPSGCDALGFFDVDNPSDRDGYPNMEIVFGSVSPLSDPLSQYAYGISDSIWNKNYRSYVGRDSWYALPALLKPKSRGRILLKDKNIKTHPRIIPNYLSHPEDVRIIIEGINATLRISETESMQQYGSQLLDASLPGCEDLEFHSYEYWECAARSLTFTLYHHSGTCKMGPENDTASVVNPRLQVIGVRGLRVADASIMPVIPSGHLQIPTIMITEKLADMVKEDYGYAT